MSGSAQALSLAGEIAGDTTAVVVIERAPAVNTGCGRGLA
jgi:hypothetical protein